MLPPRSTVVNWSHFHDFDRLAGSVVSSFTGEITVSLDDVNKEQSNAVTLPVPNEVANLAVRQCMVTYRILILNILYINYI